MQSNGLEANKVVSSGNTAGDGRGPCVVVVDHLATAPVAGSNSTADQAGLVDLEPIQVFGVGIIAAPLTVSHVSKLEQRDDNLVCWSKSSSRKG